MKFKNIGFVLDQQKYILLLAYRFDLGWNLGLREKSVDLNKRREGNAAKD
jgi:hypothetical protein